MIKFIIENKKVTDVRGSVENIRWRSSAMPAVKEKGFRVVSM